jgi:hypothetical protein
LTVSTTGFAAGAALELALDEVVAAAAALVALPLLLLLLLLPHPATPTAASRQGARNLRRPRCMRSPRRFLAFACT